MEKKNLPKYLKIKKINYLCIFFKKSKVEKLLCTVIVTALIAII